MHLSFVLHFMCLQAPCQIEYLVILITAKKASFLSGMSNVILVWLLWQKLCNIWVQPKVLYPVRDFLCIFRQPAWENALSHWSHQKSFSPEWVFICDFILGSVAKALLHWVQPNGFPPVCFILCVFRLPASVKALLNWVQQKGFFLLLLIVTASLPDIFTICYQRDWHLNI